MMTNHDGRRATIAAGALLFAAMLAITPPPQALGDDEKALDRQALQRTVRENCLICHSDELVGGQRLTPKQWKTEVEKMVGWGAPLPKEQQQPVIDFLSAEYPVSAPTTRLARLTLDEARALEPMDFRVGNFRGRADRGESVYLKNCANCHGADGQGSDLGTNLVEKPVLFIQAQYRDVVRKGRGRMPSFGTAALDDASHDDILAWLRSRRYHPVIPSRK